MKTPKKTTNIRIYDTSRKRLKAIAGHLDTTIVELVDVLSRAKSSQLIELYESYFKK